MDRGDFQWFFTNPELSYEDSLLRFIGFVRAYPCGYSWYKIIEKGLSTVNPRIVLPTFSPLFFQADLPQQGILDVFLFPLNWRLRSRPKWIDLEWVLLEHSLKLGDHREKFQHEKEKSRRFFKYSKRKYSAYRQTFSCLRKK